MLKNLLLTILCNCCLLPLKAQQADTTRLFSEMRKIHAAYHANGLQYQVNYTYSPADRPSVVLDSIRSQVEVSAGGSRIRMQNMEFITNERYAIVLFSDDKVMYLYKPSSATSSDPMEQLRGLVASSGLKQIEFSESGKMRQINIRFDSTSGVKGIEMQISQESGLITAVRYLVKTELMTGGGALSEEERKEYGDLALVTMQMRQYAPLAANRQQVHEDAYFTKEEDEYIPTEVYKEYQIFKGSVNL